MSPGDIVTMMSWQLSQYQGQGQVTPRRIKQLSKSCYVECQANIRIYKVLGCLYPGLADWDGQSDTVRTIDRVTGGMQEVQEVWKVMVWPR